MIVRDAVWQMWAPALPFDVRHLGVATRAIPFAPLIGLCFVRVAVCCSVLQCVTVCCSVFECVTVLQCVAACYSVPDIVVMCCSVLECVTVLQCVAAYYSVPDISSSAAFWRFHLAAATRAIPLALFLSPQRSLSFYRRALSLCTSEKKSYFCKRPLYLCKKTLRLSRRALHPYKGARYLQKKSCISTKKP